jgi:hypothetical protein
VLGADVQLQRLHHPGQARGLAAGQVEDQPGQRRGVDDRVLERLLQPAADQVGVEGVVAVLDQDRAPREAQEGGPGIPEAGRADQHRAIDLVPLLRVSVDGGARLDQGVEEGERAREPEALGADLDHQEGRVAGRLHVQRHVLGLVERGVGGDRRALRQQLREERFGAGAGLKPHVQ